MYIVSIHVRRRTFKKWFFAEITGDRPRQPANEIKLMLSRVL